MKFLRWILFFISLPLIILIAIIDETSYGNGERYINSTKLINFILGDNL